MTPLKAMNTRSVAESSAPLSHLYQRLLTLGDEPPIELSRVFLHQQLQEVEPAAQRLPTEFNQLMAWVEDHCAQVARQYADYLQARQQGGGRRYLSGRAHALYFLQAVAPTKRVDGAWLYGTLKHWQDYRYDGLITTYLEELGEGEVGLNHVALYRRLLAEEDCEGDLQLSDEHYRQGVIQLALGHAAESFMPEVLGYNLGYEQLPLHLLICAYELRELGIDPYYFTLHVTIDNVSSGHARKAVQAVTELAPIGLDADSYWQRVACGYQLNNLGLGTLEVIQSFDLEREVVAMLERKQRAGRYLHSDRCRFEGKTVNQWLEQTGCISSFLQALQDTGWIRRHENPQESRFWRLIEGRGAAMFGVFSGYEKQLLKDWISGRWQAPASPVRGGSVCRGATMEQQEDPETCALRQILKRYPPEQQIDVLLPWLSAPRHSRPAGLFAARHFMDLRARMR
ncbi:iron-containing redox enzyme family protein [Pseudomonas vanderleydeniana]|uniref:Iron-containing redox enzyme family protein n=1 Tax=Pseudomonas vanderleydeniana TaxID=2745495 RepID=A0A9E6TQA9_9PSED|nr:iron-containing redox enzyme family protein [Pseudomonas vanderleydeniana]QXI26321.1 iron-containing redox enzyme family protein [Pseudomonas vanderleydeniana]